MRLISVFTNTLAFGIIVVLLTVAATVGSLLFLALGSLLAWISPLSLFQGVCTAMGATVAMTLIALLMVQASRANEAEEFGEDEDADDDWLDADEDDEDGSVIDVPAELPRSPKVSRNEPCSCGSGKKFKKCCGSGRDVAHGS